MSVPITFTSMDVAVKVGEAVLNANQERGVKVDIHYPDKEIFVEVRDNQTFIFSQYCDGTGGLPMGSQGKVLVVLEKDTDALAAWLIMKRGCRAIRHRGRGERGGAYREEMGPGTKVLPPGDLQAYCRKYKASAIVYGYLVEDEARIKESIGPAGAGILSHHRNGRADHRRAHGADPRLNSFVTPILSNYRSIIMVGPIPVVSGC